MKIKIPFPRKQKIIVGLDIGVSAVKLSVLKVEGSALSLATADIREISSKGEFPDKTIIKNVVKALFGQLKLKPHKLIMSIYGPSLTVKLIKLPKMDEADLEKAVRWEAKKFISESDLESHILDYAVMGELAGVEGTRLSILLVAVPRAIVEERIGLIQEAKLKPEVIEINPSALTYLAAQQNLGQGEVKALIEIGFRSTQINIADANGNLCFNRDVYGVGGYDFTRSITEALKTDYEKAEALKREFNVSIDAVSQSSGPQIKEAVGSVLEKLVLEIERCWQYFLSENPDKTIVRLFLSGGGAQLIGIDKYLTQKLGLPANVLNTLDIRGLEISPQAKEKIGGNLPRFNLSLGLALRGLK